MLIVVPQHTAADLDHWTERQRWDARVADSPLLTRRIDAALDEIRAQGDDGYLGVSWGKDSVVVAHLAHLAGSTLPLVWVRVEPIANPHCALVRDDFLRRWPGAVYDEIEIRCSYSGGEWHATGTLEAGFAQAAAAYGDRYVSGIRAEESSSRTLSAMTHGVRTARVCRPILWWKGLDVFAYLHRYDLPVHPAYAMTWGGTLDRERVRVASLGGQRGTGKGRADWEHTYYRDFLRGV